MNLRLRSKAGNFHLQQIPSSTTFESLQQQVAEKTNTPPLQQKLLVGYPPKEIQCAASTPVSSLFKTGDMITVQERTETPTKPTTQPTPTTTATVSPLPSNKEAPQQTETKPTDTLHNPTSQPKFIATEPAKIQEGAGVIIRRIIPDDNSCLFNAVAYVLEGRSKSKSMQLRKVIADAVQTNPDTWSPAVLGKPSSVYQKWILEKNSWGGAIELSILSQYYQTEIIAFDVTCCRSNCFGEGSGYKQRVFLLYDGIHYDALALTPDKGVPEECDLTVFSPNDDLALKKCTELVDQEHQAGNYTNTAKFTVLCQQCNKTFVGEAALTAHAKRTGHSKFVEAPVQ